MEDNLPIEQRIKNTFAAPHWGKIGIKHHHGIDVPLFSLKTAESCGIGEFTDLTPLIQWCKDIGFDVIQLLPLNDTGNQPSPYSIISAFALNPIHLGLTQLPYHEEELVLSDIIQKLKKLNTLQRIDYLEVQKLKEQFFKIYFEKFFPRFANSKTYQNFVETQDWLRNYGLLKSLKEEFKWASWESWESPFKHPSQTVLHELYDKYKKEIQYHIFIQYLCFSQFIEVKKVADRLGVFLKGDLPILISRDSVDVWLHPEIFDLSYEAGAPPDMYNWDGQVWGFPIYNWENLEKENYQWWKKRLEVASLFYHLFRLDHVVGFFRIWAVPLGKRGNQGKFIPEDEQLWIKNGKEILQEILASSTMLPIAEDLGTVPPESRKCLIELGIPGTRVMRWERMWDEDKRFIPFDHYHPLSMTTLSTHDSETLEQWWRTQGKEVKDFSDFLNRPFLPELNSEYRYELLKKSHETSSLFHINLLNEYLALNPEFVWEKPEDERINLPGIISDKNWSYRLKVPLETIIKNDEFKKSLQSLINN